MATNKKSSTSKTARVMNLLSKNREEVVEPEVTAAEPQETPAPAPAVPSAEPAAAEAAAPVAAPIPAPAPVHHPSTPPLISSMQADSAISDQVFSALESALDSELRDTLAEEAPAAPIEAAELETAGSAVSEADPISDATDDAVNDAVSDAIAQITEAEEAVVEAAEASVVPSPAPSSPAPADADSKTDKRPHPPTRFPVDTTTIYVNVMESLVEDKAMKYIELFGLCKCHRCVADVKALALNRLEPKYVVMHTGEVIPRITLYEGQFSAAVTAQLLTACKMVMEHPRHDR